MEDTAVVAYFQDLGKFPNRFMVGRQHIDPVFLFENDPADERPEIEDGRSDELVNVIDLRTVVVPIDDPVDRAAAPAAEGDTDNIKVEAPITVKMDDRVAQLADKTARAVCQSLPIEDDMGVLPCVIDKLGRPDRNVGSPFP
jgi:hypothetical protein